MAQEVIHEKTHAVVVLIHFSVKYFPLAVSAHARAGS